MGGHDNASHEAAGRHVFGDADDRYREAWNLFKQGLEAVFPGGTLLMAKRYHQPCEPLDAACWCELACT